MAPVAVDEQTLSIDDILNAPDTDPVRFEVPEWSKNGKPGVVWLKPWNADDSVEFTDLAEDPVKGKRAMVYAVAMTLVNEAGQRLFSADDVARLSRKSVRAYKRLQAEVIKMNNIEIDKVKVIEGALKND